MIVSIHQPHFLPWAGYFNKVLRSDVFVWLNNVQYRSRYYQNRAKIKNHDKPVWLTLPVHAERTSLISEVTLVEEDWRARILKTIEYSYARTPFFAQCWPALSQSFGQASDTLDDVNYQTFLALLGLLDGTHVRIERADAIALTSEDPTKRLVEICTHFGATHYIAGRGGHSYMELQEFASAGVEIAWQDFDFNELIYPQPGETFVPGLSAIDCLFNVGPQKTRDLITQAWSP